MPAHDRVWPDDGEALGPTAPEAAQEDPEESVSAPYDRVSSTGQSGELLAEGQVLGHQVAARAQSRVERRQESHKEAKHRAGEDQGPGLNRQWFQHGPGSGDPQGGKALPITLSPDTPKIRRTNNYKGLTSQALSGCAPTQARTKPALRR